MESKKTPFYEMHILNRAKIVDFAGYKMPMFYQGILPEHMQVRERVGVFDVSHMGEFKVYGDKAGNFIQKIVTNNVLSLNEHRIQYNAMCYPDGGIVDDLLVYKLKSNEWMLVVNASNLKKDWDWINANKSDGVELEDISEKTALLAVQGPKSENVLQKLTKFNLSTLPFYNSAYVNIGNIRLLISRTGYTGEDGFELYHSPEHSAELWNIIFEAGKEFEIQPIGLGARDSLRLEMKYALYGNDIDQTTNPIEAGLSWVVDLNKEYFIGKEALIQAQANKTRRLVCIETNERSFPRRGYKILNNEEEIGEVTSGILSPSLGKGIAIAYVNMPYHKTDTDLFIKIRDRNIPAKVVRPPLYKDGTVKPVK